MWRVQLVCAAAATVLTPRDEFPLAGLAFAGAAISGANAEHEKSDPDAKWHRLYALNTGQGGQAKLVSIAPDNELFLNGVSVATLDQGEIWTGAVSDFDEFYASGPIYGTVRADGEHAAPVPAGDDGPAGVLEPRGLWPARARRAAVSSAGTPLRPCAHSQVHL